MTKFRVSGKIRRVGNSLALLLRAEDAARARLFPGQRVEAWIEPTELEALGLLSDLPFEPFLRHREGTGRDRV